MNPVGAVHTLLAAFIAITDVDGECWCANTKTSPRLAKPRGGITRKNFKPAALDAQIYSKASQGATDAPNEAETAWMEFDIFVAFSRTFWRVIVFRWMSTSETFPASWILPFEASLYVKSMLVLCSSLSKHARLFASQRNASRFVIYKAASVRPFWSKTLSKGKLAYERSIPVFKEIYSDARILSSAACCPTSNINSSSELIRTSARRVDWSVAIASLVVRIEVPWTRFFIFVFTIRADLSKTIFELDPNET